MQVTTTDQDARIRDAQAVIALIGSRDSVTASAKCHSAAAWLSHLASLYLNSPEETATPAAALASMERVNRARHDYRQKLNANRRVVIQDLGTDI